MSKAITFAGLDLQSTDYVTSKISGIDGAPSRKLRSADKAFGHGGILTRNLYEARKVTIEGTVKGTSSDDLESNIDTLKKTLDGTSHNLDVYVSGATRRFVGTVQNIFISREQEEINNAGFSIEVICDDPFGSNTSAESTVTDTYTTTSETTSITNGGTFEAWPTITLDINSIVLLDDFGSFDSSLWTRSDAAKVTVSGGQATLATTASTTSDEDLTTVDTSIDFTDMAARVKLVDEGNQALTTYKAMPVYVEEDANNAVWIQIDNDTMRAMKKVSSVDTEVDTITFDSSEHVYLRIRVEDGSTYWEYSADGTSWTILASGEDPITYNTCSVSARVEAAASEGSATNFDIDEYRIHRASLTEITLAGGDKTLRITTDLIGGEQIVVDCDAGTTEVDGTEIEVYGIYPTVAVGTNNIEYTDNLEGRDVDATIDYTKRWL